MHDRYRSIIAGLVWAGRPSQNRRAPIRTEGRTMQYTIRSGDTLSRIAAVHGTTLQTLLNANPRYRGNPGLIHVGDVILIPSGDAPGLAEAAPPAFAARSVGSSAACRASTRPAGAGRARFQAGWVMPAAFRTAATR
jgi:hypothetical protein